ncbi:MAG: MarR family transcriptional regulator [Thermodesulfobacteriota bacterium]
MLNYDDCIVYLLAKAYQKAHANLKKRLQAVGLTPVQALVLAAVAQEEGSATGDIGKKLTLDNATLSGVLDRLAEGGWVLKEKDQEDKRFVRIYLSEKTRRMAPVLVQEREKANEEILGRLSVEEKILLRRLLKDVQG